MRILVINVNTSEQVTEAIGQQARAVAGESTEIVPLTPHFGAESVELPASCYSLLCFTMR